MLAKFEITGVHTDINDNLRKYVTKKIGRLDKYLPRHHRDAAHAIVELKESKSKDNKKYTCAVTLHLPQETINVSETTLNMFASVDIIETKLKHCIQKYKDKHASARLTRHLTAKLRRKTDEVSFTDQQLEAN